MRATGVPWGAYDKRPSRFPHMTRRARPCRIPDGEDGVSVPENRLGQRGLSITNARHGPRELVLGHCPLKGCRVSLELDDLEGRIDSPPRPPRPVLPFGDNGAHSYRSRRPSAKIQAAGVHARASHAPTLLEARVCTGNHAKAAVDLARLLLPLAALPISPLIAQENPKAHDDDVDDECHGRQYGGQGRVPSAETAGYRICR